MANTIALFKNYIDQLDEVYKRASLTAVLDSDAATVRMGANAGEFLIPKISMDGLADYSRSSGYVAGSVTLEHETKKADYDRGRKFSVDAMDNEETAGVAFGQLAAEFIRTKVVPEMDAYRLAKIASKAANSATGALADGAAVMSALEAGINAQDEAEVPEESRILFITPTLYNAVRALDTTKSRELLDGFGSRIVKVPQTRFYTVIDLHDGSSSGETDGGYVKDATSGQNINFMIAEKSSVLQFAKHTVSKIITPEQNQESDGWLFFYRAYALADVYENKTAGIYVHSAA